MCQLIEEINNKQAIGYKVVAEKNNKNYSVAMGFCYDRWKKIPKIKKQKQLTHHFRDNILKSGAFKSEMVGRTAIFTKLKDTIYLYADLLDCIRKFTNYKIVIKKAIVSTDLMKGSYRSVNVIAGREITFLNTVSLQTLKSISNKYNLYLDIEKAKNETT